MAWDGEQGQVFHWDTCFPPHSADLSSNFGSHCQSASPVLFAGSCPSGLLLISYSERMTQGAHKKTWVRGHPDHPRRRLLAAIWDMQKEHSYQRYLCGKKNLKIHFFFLKLSCIFYCRFDFSHTPYHHSLYSTLFSCYYPFNTIASPINVAAHRTLSGRRFIFTRRTLYFASPRPVIL